MENGARFIVTTHWGTFSLDEGAYQDYLAGRLWISWMPGKQASPETPTDALPPHVTERAITLRDRAERSGLLPTLQSLGIHKAAVPYSERLKDLSIDEMNLSVRSGNGLKRANAATFGKLKDLLSQENGLLSVRNLGQKSAAEIRHVFFTACYARLLPYEKAQYWQQVLDADI